MIQVYRIEDSECILHKEVCRECAIRAKEQGYMIVYDMYLSERYPKEVKNCECDICSGEFFVDGRKVTRGDIKSNIHSFC